MKKIAFIVVAALVWGAALSCHNAGGHDHEHEHAGEAHDHDHDHAHDAEKITLYAAGLELYAEASPLIVGERCKVLSHLTWTSEFKPVKNTKATLTLVVGDSRVSSTIESPEKAGIYEFVLKPEAAGCGKLVYEVQTGDSVARLEYPHIHVVASHEDLHKHSHDHGHDHGHSHNHGHSHDHGHAEAPANAITFTKEQSWKIDFGTEFVRYERFGQVVKASAQVVPSNGDEREVTAKASGIVVFADPNITEGTAVKAGQKLFTIESSGMADNNMNVKFQEAAANYALAKETYDRKQQLVADKLVTQAELQQAKAAYQTAKAVYDNLKGNFSQSGQTVSSPMAGYVRTIAVRNGSYVDAGQPVIAVTQNKDLVIRADVQPKYYQDLAHVTGATVKVPGSDRVYDIAELGGLNYVYGRSANSDNALIPVTLKVRNVLNLLSGSFVTLYLRTTSDEEVVTVSNEGIVEEMGNYFIFVQVNPELFEKRMVTLGGTDGRRTVVTSGLKAGERVVSRGASMVKLAQNSGALDPHAGHVH